MFLKKKCFCLNAKHGSSTLLILCNVKKSFPNLNLSNKLFRNVLIHNIVLDILLAFTISVCYITEQHNLLTLNKVCFRTRDSSTDMSFDLVTISHSPILLISPLLSNIVAKSDGCGLNSNSVSAISGFDLVSVSSDVPSVLDSVWISSLSTSVLKWVPDPSSIVDLELPSASDSSLIPSNVILDPVSSVSVSVSNLLVSEVDIVSGASDDKSKSDAILDTSVRSSSSPKNNNNYILYWIKDSLVLSNMNKASLVWVSSSSNTGSIRNDS